MVAFFFGKLRSASAKWVAASSWRPFLIQQKRELIMRLRCIRIKPNRFAVLLDGSLVSVCLLVQENGDVLVRQ